MTHEITLDAIWGLKVSIEEDKDKALSSSFTITARGNGQTSPVRVRCFIDDGGALNFFAEVDA